MTKNNLKKFTKKNIGWLYVLPVIIIIIVFKIVPVFDSLRLSFFSWNGWSEMKFVGLRNYIEMFTKDEYFKYAFKNSIVLQYGITFGEIVLGTFLAILIDLRIRFWRFYRIIFFLPYVLSIVVVIGFWGKVFQYDGLLNNILELLNLEGLKIYWLMNPNIVIAVAAFIMIWQFTSFSMIFTLAALQNIDNDVYEAAKLDGVNNFQRVFKVSLPLIKNVLSILTIFLLVVNFRIFETIFILTGGGPADSTHVLGTLLYKYAFKYGRLGYSSVIAVIAILIAMTLGIVYIKISGYKNKG